MDFLDLLKQRYSVRNFAKKEINRNDIDKMILAASLAPSACNKKPWKFIVINNENLKLELCNKAFNTPTVNFFVKNSATIIVACSKTNFLVHKFCGFLQNVEYNLLDMGASIQNLILQATELGIGSCWIGWFNEKNIKKLLKIPFNYKVVSLIALGYEETESRKIEKIKDLDFFQKEISDKKIINFNKFE